MRLASVRRSGDALSASPPVGIQGPDVDFRIPPRAPDPRAGARQSRRSGDPAREGGRRRCIRGDLPRARGARLRTLPAVDGQSSGSEGARAGHVRACMGGPPDISCRREHHHLAASHRRQRDAHAASIHAATTLAGVPELESHSGPIDIVFMGRGDVELDAATITGTITNWWTNTRPTKGSEGRGMTLVTSSGMGGSKIVVRTFKGMVQVRGK